MPGDKKTRGRLEKRGRDEYTKSKGGFSMRRIGLVFVVLFTTLCMSTLSVTADNLYYPFESITITEAKTFEIVIPEGVQEGSLLYGLVEQGETITVYVATIVLQEIGGTNNSSASTVLILTNAEDEDIIRFIINNGLNNIGVESYQGFASHILIDSTMGVFKNMDLVDSNLGIQEISVHHVFENNQLTLIDNTGLVIPMVENSYQVETGLSIVISVNAGGE